MIIICGQHLWNKRAGDLIDSYVDQPCYEIDSLQIINFGNTKKIVKKADALVVDLDNTTPTMIEIMTIAQCFDVPVIGLATNRVVPPRTVSLCDDIIDSNGDDLSVTILQYTRGD